ncbi:STAS domain-containing protein [Streptomyces sp. NBC_00435]|uniref:STAS domain-containing protein n=1 Tax=Streptomyces sp. NBC_00435 TaxID=2903649 RepID=UPI002E1E0BB0
MLLKELPQDTSGEAGMTRIMYEPDLGTIVVGDLEIDVEAGPPGTVRVRVSGEIGLDNAAVLRDTLLIALAVHRGNLLLDLEGVAFCDCAGLNALLSVRAKAQRAGRGLRITAAGGAVERLLQLTGCGPLLT